MAEIQHSSKRVAFGVAEIWGWETKSSMKQQLTVVTKIVAAYANLKDVAQHIHALLQGSKASTAPFVFVEALGVTC